MEDVTRRLQEAVRAGGAITVHGDYDVDGVCSTAILVAALREVGGAATGTSPTGWATATG